MGNVVVGKIEYDSFRLLNAVVNQYKYHMIKIYNELRGDKERIEYEPTIWSMGRIFKLTVEDPILDTVSKLDGIKSFPVGSGFRGYFSEFETSFRGTFFPYKPSTNQRGGNLLAAFAKGAAVGAAMDQFQRITRLWNMYRWYLLELRWKRGDSEVANQEHNLISAAVLNPVGKLFRGMSMSAPVDDPLINGLERPPLRSFIEELNDSSKRVQSNSSQNGRRTQSQRRRRSQSPSQNKNRTRHRSRNRYRS